MSLIERFMGIPQPNGLMTDLVANPAIEKPLSLQVLFPSVFDFDGIAIGQALRSLDPVLEKARAETTLIDDSKQPDNVGNLIGLAGWGPHIIKIVYFEMPIPSNIFEACVQPAHFMQQLKNDAAEHKSHALLYYAGEDSDPLEQYAALATVAAALARLDAILILNEEARAAFPAEALLAAEDNVSLVESLRSLPIPLLYGGFVKVEVEERPGVWMRTFGNHLMGLPNLATHADSHALGNECFDLFTNVLMYAREENVEFSPNETVELGPGLRFRIRERADSEWWLRSEGQMLVLDRV
ncbi:DUF4261 domain-containing protein [Telmatocola sphagniphila]|uniref:DUF4261 domain-containing protein n=1 Tax=Telmatocola sphagniphila TaxID=1123043 RepID=A0A8E6B3K2_9BACT|nr:DUF4261 domain-containing protein [Telmatocola sphagniphila]QVL31303.1 DUF4261 domain-containing protein [Telmatocola sphagniphila]